MKWLIQVFGGDPGQGAPEPRAMAEMIQQMREIDDEFRSAGELVFEQGLDFPANGRVVEGDDVRRGSHADPAHSIQGLWILELPDESRAVEIAQRISRIAFGSPVEVRLCADGPPDLDEIRVDGVSGDVEIH